MWRRRPWGFRLATAMAALGLTGVVVAMGFAGPDGVLLASVAFLALALALTVRPRRS
jgi:uncharacterized membrane protein YadS